jgi:putative aldouronate transport system substrate-binding protein
MYITNENGDAPVLSDIRGYGYLYNMITTDCERPDLVIKLFDFLTSDEGQRLVSLGVEGLTWQWADSEHKQIAYTEEYLKEKATGTTAKYGMLAFDLLLNYQYYDNVQPQTNHGKTEGELYRSNLKRPLTVYSYDFNATHFVVDTTDERYQTYSNALSKIENLIGTQLPKIIKAKDQAEAKSIYDKTVKSLNDRNLSLVIEMNSEAYAKCKEKLGITVAWPPYMEDYVNPLDRTKPNGDLSLYRGY